MYIVIIGVEYSTTTEYINKINEKTRGTFLEGLGSLYRNNYEIIEFYLKVVDKNAPTNYIGTKESLVIEGFNIDKFWKEVDKSDCINRSEIIEFITKYLGIIKKEINRNYNRDEQYIEDLSEFYGSIYNGVNAKSIESDLSQRYNEIKSRTDYNGEFIIPDLIEDTITIISIFAVNSKEI